MKKKRLKNIKKSNKQIEGDDNISSSNSSNKFPIPFNLPAPTIEDNKKKIYTK